MYIYINTHEHTNTHTYIITLSKRCAKRPPKPPNFYSIQSQPKPPKFYSIQPLKLPKFYNLFYPKTSKTPYILF